MTVRSGALRVACGLVLGLSVVAIGCGDDENADDGGGDKDAGSSGTGGGGGEGGTGGGGAGGAGGTGGLGGGACDMDITAETSCGGADCTPIESPLATQVCAITCCTEDDACGTRRAFAEDPTDCLPPAEPDEDCPDYSMEGGAIMGFDAGSGMVFPGCCAPSGRCGIISTIDMSCITSSALLPDLMPGDECGDGDAGTEDAGL